MKFQTIALLTALGIQTTVTSANRILLRPSDEAMAAHALNSDIYELNNNSRNSRNDFTEQSLVMERQYEMKLEALVVDDDGKEVMETIEGRNLLLQSMGEAGRQDVHQFELNLPTMTSNLSVDLKKTNVADGHWSGITDDNSEVFVQYVNGRLVASINQSDGAMHSLMTRPDGSLWMTTIMPQDRMEEEDLAHDLEVMAEKHDERDDGPVVTPRDGPGKVDVLVVYTTAAMCRAAGQGTSCPITTANKQPIEDLITLAVSNNNIAHVNSQTGTQINLRHMYLDDTYTEPGSQSTSLGDLTTNGDGKLDSAHTVRNAVGADMVALILASGSGIAYVNSSASYAFSTTNYSYISGHTFAHELGHNWGCYHNRADSGTQVAYAHGYQDPNKQFRSILSYPCSGANCPRVNWYSNDVANYNGQPIGDVENDCARKINERRNTVANFRQEVSNVTPAPVTPAPVTPAPVAGTNPPYSPSAIQEAIDFLDEAIEELEALL